MLDRLLTTLVTALIAEDRLALVARRLDVGECARELHW